MGPSTTTVFTFVQHASPAMSPRQARARARRGSVGAPRAIRASSRRITPNVLVSKCGSATLL